MAHHINIDGFLKEISMLDDSKKNPRILIVTPEVTYLPEGMGNIANRLTAKAGGLADVSAALISALFDQGADVHVALPDYRGIFSAQLAHLFGKELDLIRRKMPDERIHLAEDRVFYYLNHVYSNYGWENLKIALSFQREVINNIIPRVRPDLIHCNDWMTGLIPSVSRKLGIPCLFTIHNIHTKKTFLSSIEDTGIDAASFWQNLYYERMAYDYWGTRESNPVDLLTSGVFASHFVNTVSPTFLMEIIEGKHNFVEPYLKQELSNKWSSGCAVGILNAPDSTFNPATDSEIECRYSEKDFTRGKTENKIAFQKKLGLLEDSAAPMFFWPSRLDSIQKGSQLLAEIFYAVVSSNWEKKLQVVFVANGEYQQHFKCIVDFHRFQDRVAVCDYDEKLERMAYAASDFVLMPSRFEPCGLPQMIGPIYGSIPVAHDTGGLHDTITELVPEKDKGNGVLFKFYDTEGLLWAIRQAIAFYDLPQRVKQKQIKRIMVESLANFNHSVTARQYINLYEKMLQRPLINTW
ncbi:MAG: starch synthase [Thermodesulfobacteriota bacterium]|nr:starch synthase [Thermodesulfobacteriota bacterium]